MRSFSDTMFAKVKSLQYTRNWEHQLAMRDPEASIAIDQITSRMLASVTDVKPEHVQWCALLSNVLYTAKSEDELRGNVASMGLSPEPCDDEPFFQCGMLGTTDSLPLCWMAVFEREVEQRGRKCTSRKFVTLFFAFRGSNEALDWTTNFDARPTTCQSPCSTVHSGMFAIWNNYKASMEDKLREFLEDEHELDRVFFTGHSLGGGVAQLCNLQMWSAAAPCDWPQREELRSAATDGVPSFAVTFAAPPMCLRNERNSEEGVCIADTASNSEGGKPEETDDERRFKLASEHSSNFIMEWDMVPRLGNKTFVEDALSSVGLWQAEEKVGKIGSRWLAPGMNSTLAGLVETGSTIMGRLFHYGSLCMVTATPHPDHGWRVVLLHGDDDKTSMLDTPWPFKGAASDLPVVDHSFLPRCVDQEWKSDQCSMMSKSQDCDQLKEGEEEADLLDCKVCRKSYCRSCFRRTHTEKICNWHVSNPRPRAEGALVMVRKSSKFQALVEKDVEAVLKEMNWFSNAMQKEHDSGYIGAMNIFWMCDLVKDAGFAWIGSGCVGVSSFDATMAVAIGVVKSGVCLYQYFWTGEIDTYQFWSGITTTWLEVAGSIGGVVAGAWAGALIGALTGPLGAVVGAVIGGAIGAICGRFVGRALGQAFVDWLFDANEDQKEVVALCMICQSMLNLDMVSSDLRPSTIEIGKVRKAFRKKAVNNHPDKTGLSGRMDLSDAEQKELQAATQVFQKIQHDCETLEAFIKERKDPKIWPQGRLERLDGIMPKVRGEYAKIDAGAEKQKMQVLQKLAISS